jgi:hypothetical protein
MNHDGTKSLTESLEGKVDTFFIATDMTPEEWEVIARVDGRFHYFTEGKHSELGLIDFENRSGKLRTL